MAWALKFAFVYLTCGRAWKGFLRWFKKSFLMKWLLKSADLGIISLSNHHHKGQKRETHLFNLPLKAVFFTKNGAAIHKFKRKLTFGLPRICTLTLCKFSQWQIPCHTYKFFRIDLIFIIITALCHTEALAEVSINLKRNFSALRRGYFALNLKRVFNSMDFSLVSLTQNDKCLRFFCCALQPVGSPFYKKALNDNALPSL